MLIFILPLLIFSNNNITVRLFLLYIKNRYNENIYFYLNSIKTTFLYNYWRMFSTINKSLKNKSYKRN